MIRLEQGFIEPPAWMTAAEIAAVVYEAVVIAWLLVVRRRPDGKFMQVLRRRYVDAADRLTMIGMGVFMLPTSVALVLTFLGLPLEHLYCAVAFSLITMTIWIWLCRPRNTAWQDRTAA